jgi:lipopolysaccharide heptosyltransferase II
MEKILLIRFSSLGDILLTSPVIRSLRYIYPNAKIDFVIKHQFADIYRYNPNINQLIFFEKENTENLRQDLLSAKYDLIIDLQNSWRSRRLLKGVEARRICFRKPTVRKLLLVWLKINFLEERKSIVERYAGVFSEIVLDEKGSDLYVPPDLNPSLKPGARFIGMCPGSKHFTKRWPSEYFIELGNQLVKSGYQIVIFGGLSDRDICAFIASKIEKCINLQNNDQLLQTAADMKMCDLIVTNDSGLMHCASAVGVPIVAIFGSTVQEFGFAPYQVKNSILENNSLSCRPCSHIGRSNCPKKHFKCMKEIIPQMVLKSIKELLPSL